MDALQDIMNKLSFEDASSLRNTFPDSAVLSACYEKRADMVSYFRQTFDYPITLMAAMFDTGAILSGSRALEFFFPGSIHSGSCWDFYVPAYKESAVDMVNALQICGVNWNTDASNLASNLFNHGKTTMSRVMLEGLDTWLTSLGEEPACRILGQEVYDITQAYRRQMKGNYLLSTAFDITLDAEKNIKLIPILEGGFTEKRPFSTLHGTITTSKGCENVQLIICSHYDRKKGCMSFVGDFFASHIQCFIGGWCAGHLHYNQTNQKKARIGGHFKDSLILRAMQKHKTRGYELTDGKGSGLVRRSLDDDKAKLIVYGRGYYKYVPAYCYSILNDWNDQRQDNFETITWVESDGSILGFHSLLEQNHHDAKTFSGSGKELPMCARRRLGNIIAANTECPDELRSPAYRSSVGRDVMQDGWEMQTVARSGTASCFFEDATPWSWVL